MHHPTKVKKGFNKQTGWYTEGQTVTAEVQNQQTTMCQFYGQKNPHSRLDAKTQLEQEERATTAT